MIFDDTKDKCFGLTRVINCCVFIFILFFCYCICMCPLYCLFLFGFRSQWIMNFMFLCLEIEIKSDATLAEAVKILARHNVLSAPVVDVDAPEDASWIDRYIGIIEFAGIVVWILHQVRYMSHINSITYTSDNNPLHLFQKKKNGEKTYESKIYNLFNSKHVWFNYYVLYEWNMVCDQW